MPWSGGSGKPGLDSMSSISAGLRLGSASEPDPDPNQPLSEEYITARYKE
jgi:hypothetical protein